MATRRSRRCASGAVLPARRGRARTRTPNTMTRPPSDGSASAATKCVNGMPLATPMSMFCGLPIGVRALPTFEASARPRRNGSGRSRSGRTDRDDERREHEANRVVDEKRREESACDDDSAKQRTRRPRAIHDVLRRPLEEAAHLEKARDEQHPEQKHHHVEIDRRIRVAQRQSPDRHHRHGAEQCGGRPVQPKKRYPLNGDQQVRDDEDDEARYRHANATSALARRRRSGGTPTQS